MPQRQTVYAVYSIKRIATMIRAPLLGLMARVKLPVLVFPVTNFLTHWKLSFCILAML